MLINRTKISVQGAPFKVHASSSILDHLRVTFDDKNTLSNGGLILSMTLAEKLGLRSLFDVQVDLRYSVGRANVGNKAMVIAASLLAGVTQ